MKHICAKLLDFIFFAVINTVYLAVPTHNMCGSRGGQGVGPPSPLKNHKKKVS